MSSFFERIKKELYHPMPALLFFFTTFYLMNMTWGLMLKHEGISRFSFWTILLGSVISAKVFIVIDKLPFTNSFGDKPLIFQTLWKTFLYGSFALLIRGMDMFYPFFWKTQTISDAIQFYILEVDWSRFWAIQIWFYILFFAFVAGRELVLSIGPGKVRKMFLGF